MAGAALGMDMPVRKKPTIATMKRSCGPLATRNQTDNNAAQKKVAMGRGPTKDQKSAPATVPAAIHIMGIFILPPDQRSAGWVPMGLETLEGIQVPNFRSAVVCHANVTICHVLALDGIG